ncbi:MAG: DUF1847 domain-containing protein [Anaerolineales bacterium]|nr:DUF1847 domain-containing protein [Anaerolineales bacterium]
MAEYRGPICAYCNQFACDCPPGEKKIPSYCPMEAEKNLLDEIEQVYLKDESVRKIASESARTEASGYMRRTRIEDIMDFAWRIDAKKIGIAHCIGLVHEARIAMDIFKTNGFEVNAICCKVGAVSKETLGLSEEEKLSPGNYEAMCNPIAQAALLDSAGCQLNVVVGLCVGHDSLFFKHSKAPVTVLIAKDRVLGHNPAAALYNANSYYNRLKKGQPADDYLLERMGRAEK